AVTAGQAISAGNIPNLTFVPNTDVTSQGSFQFQVTDTLTNTTSASAATMTINVTPDGGPSALASAITVAENGSYTFSTSDFGYADAADATADPLASITITSLPTARTLKRNGKPGVGRQGNSSASTRNQRNQPDTECRQQSR